MSPSESKLFAILEATISAQADVIERVRGLIDEWDDLPVEYGTSEWYAHKLLAALKQEDDNVDSKEH